MQHPCSSKRRGLWVWLNPTIEGELNRPKTVGKLNF